MKSGGYLEKPSDQKLLTTMFEINPHEQKIVENFLLNEVYKNPSMKHTARKFEKMGIPPVGVGLILNEKEDSKKNREEYAETLEALPLFLKKVEEIDGLKRPRPRRDKSRSKSQKEASNHTNNEEENLYHHQTYIGKLAHGRKKFIFNDGRISTNKTTSKDPEMNVTYLASSDDNEEDEVFDDEPSRISRASKASNKSVRSNKSNKSNYSDRVRRNRAKKQKRVSYFRKHSVYDNDLPRSSGLNGVNIDKLFQNELAQKYISWSADKIAEKECNIIDIFASQESIVIQQMLRVLNEGEQNETEVLREAIIRGAIQ